MKISNEMQAAFIDEMEKIAYLGLGRGGLQTLQLISEEEERKKKLGLIKKAGMLQNLGSSIKNTAHDIGGALNTMIAHPVQGMQAGLKTTGQQLGESIKQMRSGGPWNAIKGGAMPGLMALGLYGGIKGLKGEEDPTGMGRGKGERYGDFLGNQFGGLVGASHGLGGNIVAGIAGQKAGAAIGRTIDRIRGYTPPEGADRRMSTAAYNTFSPVPRARRARAAAPAPAASAPSLAGGQTA